jgi:AraC-like DNA-binding protein
MIYSVEGDFGKVRVLSHLPTPTAKSTFNYIIGAGWHLCNDKYRISRSAGCDTYLVFFTAGGCGQMIVDGTPYRLTEKTIGIIPPNVPHEYYVAEKDQWEFYWMHVDGISASRLLDYLVRCHGNRLELNSPPVDAFNGVEKLLFLKNASHKANFEAHASQIISSVLHGIAIELSEDDGSMPNKKNAVKSLLKLIESNYSSKISIEEACGSLFFSSAHLSRLFRAETGNTPYEYLKQYRLLKSKELLLYTDLSIKEIAVQTGFSHASNFICQFKAAETVTPSQFRKR